MMDEKMVHLREVCKKAFLLDMLLGIVVFALARTLAEELEMKDCKLA
jgi:hypothetical protein